RQFFKYCGAAAVAVSVVTPAQVRAANRIKFWMHGFDEERFGEETLLKKAMTIVAGRLQNKRIWRNVYDLPPNGLCTGVVMKNSNLIDNNDNRYNLLRHQLYWLSQPNAAGDTGPAFPNVHLRAFHEKSKVVGRARTDLVIIRSVGDSFRQTG